MSLHSTPTKNHTGILSWVIILLIIIMLVLGFMIYRLSNKVDVLSQSVGAPATHQMLKLTAKAMNPHMVTPSVQQIQPAHQNSQQQMMPGMSAQAVDPFLQMRQMQEQMNQMMHQTFRQAFGQGAHFNGFFYAMPRPSNFEVKENGQDYVITMHVPNIDKKQIKININNQMLTVSGQVNHTDKKQTAHGHIVTDQQYSQHFMQRILLSKPVEAAAMKYTYKKGVLAITIPLKK